MSFAKSAINQLGRDMGKVVSNQIFKDAHATPYRRVGGSSNGQTPARRVVKTDFEKSINFLISYRPATLVNKMMGAYSTLKSEANYYISDGYLDADESDSLFGMLQEFSDKSNDVYEALELDQEANAKEIDQLNQIYEKVNLLVKDILTTAAEGSLVMKERLEHKADKLQVSSFGRYVGLHAIWMGKYAKTGRKDLAATIIANFASLFLFPIPHLIAFLTGLLTYSGEKNKVQLQKSKLLKMAELEGDRASVYQEVADSRSSDLV